MLMPKRVKRRRVHRGNMRGQAQKGNNVTYGEFGLVALEPAWITSNQIEAARIAMTRYIKREWSIMAIDYYKSKIPLKKGVKEFICFLKNNNIKIGIGTSNSKELAIEVLKTHDILDYFDIIRTSCEVNKGKPNPDIFLKVAEDLGVNANECLVFEDTYAGVLAGKRAGMKVFAIADEVSFPYKEEIIGLADKYIEDFVDIA